MAQINTFDLTETGFVVPPGWYGWVDAAGPGIVHRSGIDDQRGGKGMAALHRLASPDPESRSAIHEGRRMVRVDGGFVILNYFLYREKDYSTAERSRRYRERKKRLELEKSKQRDVLTLSRETVSESRDITQAEAEAKEIREEKTPLPPASGGIACHGSDGIFELPEDLRELADCWRRWLDYRKEIRKPVKPRSAAQAFADFRRWGVTASRTAIDASIRNGWQGLFEPKIGGGNGSAVVDHAGERVANAEKRRNDQLARVNAMLMEEQ